MSSLRFGLPLGAPRASPTLCHPRFSAVNSRHKIDVLFSATFALIELSWLSWPDIMKVAFIVRRNKEHQGNRMIGT